MRRIYITTGDPDGIGMEVAAKALQQIGPKSGVQFVLFRSSFRNKQWLSLIDSRFKRFTLTDLNYLNSKTSHSYQNLIDICSTEKAPVWFQQSINACIKNNHDCIVTGPISKPLFIASGLDVMGHTGLLKKASKKKNLFMAFKGAHFNVLLVTDHIPLNQVPVRIDLRTLKEAYDAGLEFRSNFKSKQKLKPIAILGINPHAGDSNLIGSEERKLIDPFVKKLKAVGHSVVGPLVPDAAFLAENWKKFSLFICMYHDQGLIPFKAVHGQESGIQITLGLPFMRVSVDHGTAKDIFNKNKANPNSMKEAIKYAIYSKKGSRI